MSTVLPLTGRESRILRQARRVIARAFAGHSGVAITSVAGCEQRAGLIRWCIQARQILDTDLSVIDEVRADSRPQSRGQSQPANRPMSVINDGRMCWPIGTSVDLVTIGYRCGMVAERAWT